MSDKKELPGVACRVVKARGPAPVQKAETPTQLSVQASQSASEWVSPPVPLSGLKVMVSHSSILPQCIRAYKNNIAGFGIAVRYKEDYPEETPEMKTEFSRAEDIIDLLNMDMDTKEVFEDIIEARETYGISYLEVVRNGAGEVTSIEFIKDAPTVQKTMPLEPYVDTEYFFKGRVEKRSKKFCKYKQEVGGKVVYFKEIGDPRVMDKSTGAYVPTGVGLELDQQANEILEFAIGTDVYGEVRWAGQILGVDGSRKAEGLNNNYFENGRHTPLLIMIKGGTLTEESFTKLQEYMDGIKGEAGQHAFMILEAENADNRTDFTDDKQPEIEIHDLASILQKDELFQEYLDNNRRRVQSAFQLPDLYVGYTTDFNRATAQTAMEVTEKQVFQPERRSLSWAINNKLLNGYQFKYVEAYFLEPDITNPDDLAKLLNITERAGGLTPNKAKEITYEVMGDSAEPYDGEWGDVPLAYSKTQQTAPGFPDIGAQLEAQIKKAAADDSTAVVAVMKEVRSLLLQMREGGKA
ncbi:phage portal protein [Clostridium sp. D33t1_170424_F3]|uniref:phage portal protein n=1 Tax=Clostridium sp. D33t1_170424_F3 TaxID=2787099 RepID=UPI0018ABB7DC|nr:phage portal protein [Clostridium sp. D33t1_170424_F3]